MQTAVEKNPAMVETYGLRKHELNYIPLGKLSDMGRLAGEIDTITKNEYYRLLETFDWHANQSDDPQKYFTYQAYHYLYREIAAKRDWMELFTQYKNYAQDVSKKAPKPLHPDE